jgi:hypothetical protein
MVEESGMRAKVLLAALGALCTVAVLGAVGASPVERAGGFDKHLCGIKGMVLGPQERCPIVSPARRWKQLTAYRREQDSGVDMCLVVFSKDDKPIGHKCDFDKSVLRFGAAALNNGKRRVRAYNKNNNVTRGNERRYLYASTERG